MAYNILLVEVLNSTPHHVGKLSAEDSFSKHCVKKLHWQLASRKVKSSLYFTQGKRSDKVKLTSPTTFIKLDDHINLINILLLVLTMKIRFLEIQRHFPKVKGITE